MAIDHRMVHFRTDDLSEVLAEFERVRLRGDAQEWITISPWVDDENLPVVSLLRRIFSARGSQVPEVTWVPAHDGEPAQLGIVHPTGPHAFERLADAGIAVPSTWHKVSDHSRRGLLFAIDPVTPLRDVLDTAVAAGRTLSGVPTDDRWVAQVSSVVARR